MDIAPPVPGAGSDQATAVGVGGDVGLGNGPGASAGALMAGEVLDPGSLSRRCSARGPATSASAITAPIPIIAALLPSLAAARPNRAALRSGPGAASSAAPPAGCAILVGGTRSPLAA